MVRNKINFVIMLLIIFSVGVVIELVFSKDSKDFLEVYCKYR